VHLVGFIIRIYDDARSPERQISLLINLRSLVFGLTPFGSFICLYFFSHFMSYENIILVCAFFIYALSGTQLESK